MTTRLDHISNHFDLAFAAFEGQPEPVAVTFDDWAKIPDQCGGEHHRYGFTPPTIADEEPFAVRFHYCPELIAMQSFGLDGDDLYLYLSHVESIINLHLAYWDAPGKPGKSDEQIMAELAECFPDGDAVLRRTWAAA